MGSQLYQLKCPHPLAEQQIQFSPKVAFAQAKAGPGTTSMIPSVSQYAGQQLVKGSQAEADADHFIAVHLSELPYVGVYSKSSAAALSDPTGVKLQALAQTSFQGTSFQGTTVRGLLLETYAVSKIGRIMLLGATFILAVIMDSLVGLGFRPAGRTAPDEGLAPRAEPRRQGRSSEVVSAPPSPRACPPRGPEQRLRGVFVGGGVASAGTLLALRDLEGERVSLRLR